MTDNVNDVAKRGPGRPPNVVKLKLWKTTSGANLPKFQTKQAACFDLEACAHGKSTYSGYNADNKPFHRDVHDMSGVPSIFMSAGDRIMIPTGLKMDIPEGYSVRVHPRSGMALKQGLTLINGEGVIDSDYVDEVFVLLWNTSTNGVWIPSGTRIAQAELVPQERYVIEGTAEEPGQKTDRVGGMGSTGT